MRKIFLIILLISVYACKHERRDVIALKQSVKKNLFNEGTLALEKLGELLKIGYAKKDTTLLIETYLDIGILYTNIGESQQAVDSLKLGLKLIDISGKNTLRNRYLLRLGNVYSHWYEDKEALKCYTEAYENAFLNNQQEEIEIAQINIAKITRNLGKYQKALQMYKVGYKRALELNFHKKNLSRIIMGIGGTFLVMHQPDSALVYIDKGLKMMDDNDKIAESFFYHDKGMAYILKEEYSKAIQYLDKSIQFRESIGNKERMAETTFYVGKSHFALENFQKALVNFEKVSSIIEASGNLLKTQFRPLELVENYELLASCYERDAQHENASIYKSLAEDLKEISESKIAIVNEVLYERLINIKQKKIDKVEKSEKNLYKWLAIIIILLCIVLLLLLYYRQKAKKNKLHFEKLVQAQEKKTVEAQQKSKEIVITDTKVEAVLKRLEKLEEQHYFLESSCSLANMAKKAKTNTTYLTQIIKQYKEKTFYQYLNELRINYTINRLNTDHQFRKYAIKHIALEVGYKSPESFTKHFKKATGINPSYYIKELEKRLET
ncbi:helix-turn-helix domain-containing protein [Kordia sp.]|uniref:helix-turn-helix domain-containing protein n=1 Tax=Kordia sp. TaxID=1965332 RepID=UPI0025C546E8|nr:helix-turn-helix domain-containing protein [Kordia sp.]MCH2194283.1 helix-turn-helix domain-containing protein [Kordia sp.]